MAEELEFRLNVVGQPRASQQMERFRGSIGNVDAAARAANTRLQGVGSAVGNIGTILAQANPEVSRFAAVIGTASSAIGGMTTALGGVGGLIAGGLIGALGLVITRMLQTRKETEALSKATQGATKSLNDFIAAAAKAQSARSLQSRLALGVASDLEFQGALEQESRKRQGLDTERRALLQAAEGGQRIDTTRLAELKRLIEASKARTRSLESGRARARQEAAQAPELDAEEAAIAEEERAAARPARRRRRRPVDPFAVGRESESFSDAVVVFAPSSTE